MDQTHMIHEQGDLGLFAEPIIEQKENSDSESNENDKKSECK